jgi:hypothetical protein
MAERIGRVMKAENHPDETMDDAERWWTKSRADCTATW